jgi:AAA domain-containing protein
VLVVDEAGMVGSYALARLICGAEAAEAKLVLIGDPAQLGEIEAGGLFSALVNRTEPVVLDEVIRHREELEREGAKLIRSGEGAEAIAVYEGAERVTVSDDAIACREEMVADWWRHYSQGEDALMLAKRNSEVGELNQMAREVMAAEGKLGAQEIGVGEASFAVGDQVITRVNDQSAEIYNRERWQIAEVEVESGRLVLDGIDTARRVGVDSVYLERVNPRDGSPAIEHGYAATIYQAQGATLDSAFVMADPSMTKEEFYVATSRSRGETFLYATPEVELAREEFAPASRFLRGGLEHIAEAAERSGAQTAAMEEALRSRFCEMPSGELVARLSEIDPKAGLEQGMQRRIGRVVEQIAREEEWIAKLEREREAIPEAPRFERREARSERVGQERRLEALQEVAEVRLGNARAEVQSLPEISHEARAECAVIESVLADRERLAAAAARISPPTYITAELDERPGDPAKAAAWDRAVRGIESYRLREGVVDKDNALGVEPSDRERAYKREMAQRRLDEAQRQLGLQRQLERRRSLSRDLDFGIEL